MNFGTAEVLVLLTMVAWFGIWAWGLVDAARQPAAAWQHAGYSRFVTILIIVIFGLPGSAIYLLFMRPKLNAARPAAQT